LKYSRHFFRRKLGGSRSEAVMRLNALWVVAPKPAKDGGHVGKETPAAMENESSKVGENVGEEAYVDQEASSAMDVKYRGLRGAPSAATATSEAIGEIGSSTDSEPVFVPDTAQVLSTTNCPRKNILITPLRVFSFWGLSAHPGGWLPPLPSPCSFRGRLPPPPGSPAGSPVFLQGDLLSSNIVRVTQQPCCPASTSQSSLQPCPIC
jgi:hypothetical protein